MSKLLAAALILLASTEVSSASPATLRLVDDRGEEIAGGTQVCFQIETRLDCSTPSGALVPVPSGAVSVKVEGPRHGPASLRLSGAERTTTVKVARKAFLDIFPRREAPLTVSLYPQDDPTFRLPSFRAESRGEPLRVPAGDFLVSISTAGHAPSLHLLSFAPEERYRLRHDGKPGWSLALRCLSAADGRALEGASAEIRESEGYSAPASAPRTSSSGRSGLILVNGLLHPLASATVTKPGYAARREEGLSSSPGTFAFREVALERAAMLRALLTSGGKPMAGASCQLLEHEANPSGPAPEPTVRGEGRSDASGACRLGPAAAGPYRLRVRLPDSRSRVERAVDLAPGEETRVELDLLPTQVYGTVLRGTQPVEGYAVGLYDSENPVPNATRRDAVAEAVSNGDGEYEVILWAPGSYAAILEAPDGTPAAVQQVSVLGGEKQQVDFNLEEHAVAGRVVDERDQPVAGVRVGLFWNGSLRLAQTDPHGAFEFLLPEHGQGRVEVRKEGFRAPPPTEVSCEPGAPPPPLVLRLRRAGVLTGRIGKAGVRLTSFHAATGRSDSYLGAGSSDREGRFEVAAAEEGVTRVFAAGAGCPLTSFDLGPQPDEVTLACPDLPASLELQFKGTGGRPVAGKSVLIRRDGILVPNLVLVEHLGLFRLPTAADGSGRLLLPGLAPGRYDLFLAEATSPDLIAAGSPQGLLTSATLAPFTTMTLEILIEEPQ